MSKTRGDALRAEIAEQYDVEGVAAQALVEQVVRTVDELEQLEAALSQHGPLIDGARGQKVLNPALTGIARHRALLARLIGEAFPSEVDSRSDKASKAAKKRWGNRAGKYTQVQQP